VGVIAGEVTGRHAQPVDRIDHLREYHAIADVGEEQIERCPLVLLPKRRPQSLAETLSQGGIVGQPGLDALLRGEEHHLVPHLDERLVQIPKPDLALRQRAIGGSLDHLKDAHSVRFSPATCVGAAAGHPLREMTTSSEERARA
jgi:hypothetical protein